MAEVVLKETAMVRVGNTRVGCGNLWEREYALPDGSTVTGMSARVQMGNDVFYVGAGSELVVFDHLSHAGLHEDPDTLNRVTLDFLLRQRS